MIYIIIALFIILLFVASGLMCVVLETSFKENKFFFSVSIFKIKIFDSSKRKEKPVKASEKKNDEKKDFDVPGFLKERYQEIIADIKSVMIRLKKKVICEHFLFDMHFSMKDAALTGETCGILWGIIGMLLPVLDLGFTFKKNPEINITPHFENPMLSVVYEGIYKIRICHIIYIGLSVLNKLKKYKKAV